MNALQAPLLHAQGVTVEIDGSVIIEHVDLQISGGDILCVIGPNGSGKTTLLRALLGLAPLSQGKVERMQNLRIGYVPQRMPLDSSFPITLRRFLNMAGANPKQAEQAAQDVGLRPNTLNHPLQGLSGGEFQRALIAHALLREPDLLVLDEPAQGVDVNGQADLYDLIDRLRMIRGFGVIMVSHDLHVVMASANHILCLNRHVCCEGKPDAISRHPEYLALFGPQLGRSFGVYAHHHDHSHDVSGQVNKP